MADVTRSALSVTPKDASVCAANGHVGRQVVLMKHNRGANGGTFRDQKRRIGRNSQSAERSLGHLYLD